MKAKIHFYILTDCQGNRTFDVVKNLSDNICVGGYDAAGQYQQYDSYEGYHAYGWAEQHGFRLECVEQIVAITSEPGDAWYVSSDIAELMS